MVRKKSLERGNDNYTMLIDLILSLTPNQVKLLYQELKARFTNRGHTRLYNLEGEIDKEKGKVRLTPYQYQAIRTKYGDNYMKHALKEMTEYLTWLELHQDIPKYRSQLLKLNSRTHSKEMDYDGWIYNKCKKYISEVLSENVKVNPFLIDDISVARKYIESLSPEMRRMPDVICLLEKFPELHEYFGIDPEENN
jgi:hypothetical protein